MLDTLKRKHIFFTNNLYGWTCSFVSTWKDVMVDTLKIKHS
jgi:hypothetical protein